MNRLLAMLALCLLVLDVPASEPEVDSTAWETVRLNLVERDRKYSRGLALYMTDASRPALGFRCHRRKLYAFISVVPMSLRDVLNEWFRNSKKWKATYQIEDEPARSDTWISIYRGKIYMSLPDDSSSYLLNAAGRGVELEFQRKGGDPVNIDIPAIDQARVDRFIRECGLVSGSSDST